MRRVLVSFCVVFVTGCNRSDVGAPCQLAVRDPPEEPLISFPALACNQLLCVFGETFDPPQQACETDEDCARIAGTEDFACEAGRCVVRDQAVLERSMCSTTCSSDSDCESTVSTRCESGFTCAPLMSLGEFCCQKVCVCRDDLNVGESERLEENCANGDVPGCCDQSPVPDGCF